MTLTMTNPSHSYSPMRLALRRLRRHRLASVGLGMVAGMVALVLLGAYLVPTSPAETRLWLGAKPPGYTHPHCRSEALFQVGERAPLAAVFRKAEMVRYALRIEPESEVRVVLRRGLIKGISRGPEAVATVDFGQAGTTAYEQLTDGGRGRALPGGVLRVGQPPPEGTFAGDGRVLIATVVGAAEERTVTIGLADGRVTAINTDPEPVSTVALGSLTVLGSQVTDVWADGKHKMLRHPLGTDELGRDLLLRLVYGGRVSLLVGVVATLVSVLIGVSYGAIAGYVGGRADALMMRIVDILYGLPFVFLVLLLMVVFDRNIALLFIALGMVQWLTMARIVRGHVLSLREMEFVAAARMSGCGGPSIIFGHLIPQTLGPVVVYATLTVPVVIMEESFLAFIGLPVQYQGTTLDSWGSLVHLGMAGLGEGGQKWWLLVFPCLAMFATLFGLNALGDGLRDSLDPREEGR